jgi:hypothetical protein
LDLELPYREVDGQPKGPPGLFELVDGEFTEGYPLAGANLLVDAAMLIVGILHGAAQLMETAMAWTHPLMPILATLCLQWQE